MNRSMKRKVSNALLSLVLARGGSMPPSERTEARGVVRLLAPLALIACLLAAFVPADSGAADHTRGGVSGRRLFERETFGGNGRTCLTCHGRGPERYRPPRRRNGSWPIPTIRSFARTAATMGMAMG